MLQIINISNLPAKKFFRSFKACVRRSKEEILMNILNKNQNLAFKSNVIINFSKEALAKSKCEGRASRFAIRQGLIKSIDAQAPILVDDGYLICDYSTDLGKMFSLIRRNYNDNAFKFPGQEKAKRTLDEAVDFIKKHKETIIRDYVSKK